MTNDDLKVQKISLYLHKDSVSDYEDCIKDSSLNSVDTYVVKKEIGLEGKIYVHHPTVNTPDWKEVIEKLTNEEIDIKENASNKAIMILKYNNRFFSIVYGYGKSMLNYSTIVRNFGLIVAANLIDSKKIRSLNSMTIEDTIVDTQKQSTEYANQELFQVNKSREILKTLSGSSSNESIARFIVGTDSLTITRKMDIEKIKSDITFYFKTYNEDHYKRNGFDWLDNIQREKDSQIIEELDKKLIDGIKTLNPKLSIAPNKIIDWENIFGFYFTGTGKSKDKLVSIDINYTDYFQYINQRTEINIISKLKRDGLFSINNTNEEFKVSNIYEAIIFETSLNNSLYLLCYGDWYEINKNFYSQIKERIKNVYKSNLQFPSCKFKEHEGTYNERVAQSNPSYVLMDQKNYQPKAYGLSKIEPCDIFTKDKQLIHIKKGGSSSKLSHLFSQALVSSRILAIENEFRAHVNRIAQEKLLVDPLSEKDNNSDFEIIFAIIHKKEEEMENVLPFFSMVNLTQVLDTLDSMNFQYSLLSIKQEIS
ncbi:hypothetical protein BN1058_01690 [Paraliobacillus sp. PM-2]|uniref:TIGR04141 family sporadically distributed protein n=1 Tax=Paraliobacillus sp. PM-2 TaxID=1462524 RepID=UPI00061CA199|nr:TIGR04141 family sporadically distributed protein [Paraliobacillus sp. PM-2]CQR47379.1 hypothetical protein BN1058_01690 [Paraliobacillus sp. PM-2]